VAVKQLYILPEDCENFFSDFASEARTLSFVNHPHVVTFYGIYVSLFIAQAIQGYS
jgi:hypothetical protein